MSGNTDTDMGMKRAFAEIEKFKNMCVKVGVVEGTDGKLVKIAAANELGVAGPPVSETGGGEWFIPPRPFILNLTHKIEHFPIVVEGVEFL
jgi:hypothetical protein